MDMRVRNPADRTIGGLFHQTIEDGRTLVGAEINLYKEIALYRAGKARSGAIALAVGGVLALGGFIAFLVGCVMGLAPIIGPVAGGLVVLVITGIIGFVLVRYGLGKMAALSGDAEEKKALRAGQEGL